MCTEFFPEESWGRSFLVCFPFVFVGVAATDQYGITYKISDGRRVKLTRDEYQYYNAQLLLNKKLKHVGNVYCCGTFISQEDNEKVFYIITESPYEDSVDRLIFDEFLTCFRKCWFVDYFPSKGRLGNYDDIEDACRYSDNIMVKEVRILMEQEKTSNPQLLLKIYDGLCLGYKEALGFIPHVPSLAVSNLGFTRDGAFKLFVV